MSDYFQGRRRYINECWDCSKRHWMVASVIFLATAYSVITTFLPLVVFPKLAFALPRLPLAWVAVICLMALLFVAVEGGYRAYSAQDAATRPRKDPIDAEREKEAIAWLSDFTNEEKDVLRCLLKQGDVELEVNEIFSRCNAPDDVINGTLKKGKRRETPFLVNWLDTPKTGNYWKINPGYRDALQICLYPGNQ